MCCRGLPGCEAVFTFANLFLQRFAFDQFHAEERLSSVLLDLEDRDDVRMVQPCRRFSFDDKPAQKFLRGQIGPDHLECDPAVRAHLPRFVHDTHAATTNLPEQFVIAEAARQFAEGRQFFFPTAGQVFRAIDQTARALAQRSIRGNDRAADFTSRSVRCFAGLLHGELSRNVARKACGEN